MPLLSLLAAAALALSTQGAVTVDRGAADPAVSPDGSRIAASILGRIFVLPVAGGEAQQITDGVGWDAHPAWSADGQFVAYAHQMPNGTDIVLRDLATGTSRFIYHTENGIGQIAFHPKSGELFFVLERGQYDAHLWRLSLGTSDSAAKQLTFAQNWHEWSFALSPDGSQVLLESGRYGGPDLYLLKLPGLESERLTRTPQKEFAVAWAKDGKQLFIREDNGVDHVMVRTADGAAREIFASAYDQKQLAVMPDGASAILCAGRKLFRLDLATGKSTPIPFSAHFSAPDKPPADLVVTNARVFTGTSNEYVANATVEIRNGRIVSVRPSSAGTLPAGVRVLDAAGKTMVAGLMDNHWHYWDYNQGGDLLQNGITSIRDPGVAVSTSMNFKDAIALGIIAGPDLYSAGPLIDGLGGYHPMVDVELDRADRAAPLVRALKAQGVDALKVYFLLDPDVLAAVVKEAKVQGLPVTGHIGVHTSLREAMQAGIDGFSHIRVWKDFLPRERQPQGDNESLDGSKAPVARMQADWSLIDPESAEVGALITMMVSTKIALDPTLAIQKIGDDSRRRFSLEEFTAAQDSYRRMSRFVKRAYGAGVPILAGTDDGSLFDEMEAYADAGIPAADIIRTATINGARWLGKGTEFGTIEPGRRASFILVDGDPLENIRDMRKIRMVVKDGRIAFARP